jgi:hypothetical protein
VDLKNYQGLPTAIMATKTTDNGEWENYEFRDDTRNGMAPFKVELEEISHIRSQAETKIYGNKFLELASMSEDDTWIIGFDTEGNGATVQMASKEGKEKPCLQVYQLWSGSFNSCMKSGPPQKS